MVSQHAFHELFYHINWHCQEDRALITPKIEIDLFDHMESFCRKYPGAFFFGAGGTKTHVHMAVQLEPKIAPAEFIGKIKGYCSFELNKKHGKSTMKWQRGYGIVTFAKANLKAIQKYVDKQKEHHKTGSVRDLLEKFYDDPDEEKYYG